jgi:hypothetical protein
MAQRGSRGSGERAATVIAGGALLAIVMVAHGCKDIVAVTIEPVADAGGSVGQVGDPCIPTDEVGQAFSGFSLNELSIETQYNACASGICLVNHFQGRVDCPLGQAAPPPCAVDGGCPAASCQSAAASDAENAGKSCCAEGSDIEVSTAVCGQCAVGSRLTAADTVYCSCACGATDGAPVGGPYCACPDGFACEQLSPYFATGLDGGANANKYCIKQGTQGTDYTSPNPTSSQCGTVRGHFDSSCSGSAGP